MHIYIIYHVCICTSYIMFVYVHHILSGNPQLQDYNHGTLPLLLNIIRFISCMMIYETATTPPFPH